MLRSTSAIFLLLLAGEVQANELKLGGVLADSLQLTLTLTLNASNPLCWGSTHKVQATPKTSPDGSYELDAKWSEGFCAYSKGIAEFDITRAQNERMKIQAIYGSKPAGYTEFHDIDLIRCGQDPDMEVFFCSEIRSDASSVIGQNLSVDPGKTGENYHLNFVSW